MNTNLLELRTQVFIHNDNGQLKLNEIKVFKVLIKSEIKSWKTLIYKQLEGKPLACIIKHITIVIDSASVVSK